MPLLEVENLEVGYGSLTVLRDVRIKVEAGQIVSILGTNGAGKTTLLRTIAGLHRPSRGSIKFLGESIAGCKAHDVSDLGLALVPEGRQLFPDHTVLENLELGAFRRLRSGERKAFDAELEHIYELFPRLRERAQQRASLLSGGEQQMVAIARALVSRPKILLLDEPSLGLAPLIVNAIFEIFEQLRRNGTTILLVEQMAHKALELCDYGYVLRSGRLIAEGSREALISEGKILEAYLGKQAI